jgi:hypothetical protein
MANKRAEPESDDDFDQDEVGRRDAPWWLQKEKLTDIVLQRSKRSRVEEEEDGGLARLTEEQQRLEAAGRATIRANAGPRKVVGSKVSWHMMCHNHPGQSDPSRHIQDGDLLGVIKYGYRLAEMLDAEAYSCASCPQKS